MANQTFAFANGTLVTTNAHLCVGAAPGRRPEAWDPGGAVLRQPQQAELAGIYALEAKSYPADEAATEEKLEFRLEKAPEYFRALYATQASHGICSGELLGFICATLAQGEELLDETMSGHDPSGTTLCIHSVVIASQHRRRGMAQDMLARYIAEVVRDRSQQCKLLKLICKPRMVPLYAKAGFTMLGEWAGEHGSEAWMEMERRLS